MISSPLLQESAGAFLKGWGFLSDARRIQRNEGLRFFPPSNRKRFDGEPEAPHPRYDISPLQGFLLEELLV